MDKRLMTGFTTVGTVGMIALMGGSMSFADSSMVGKEASPKTTLNLRSLTTNNVIGKLSTKDVVKVLGDLGNGFVKVQTKSGVVGKCAKDYLIVKTSTTTNVSSTSSTSTTKVVKEDGLKLREGAGSSYKVIKTMSKGTTVTAYEVKYGWRKVKVGNTIGWCADQYLTNSSTSGTVSGQAVKSTTKKVINTSSLNVRSGAGTKYDKVGTLSLNTAVKVVSESNGWAKIEYKTGYAYVSTQYLGTSTSSSNVAVKKEYNNTVSSFSTSYNNKNDRAKNVELAARKINNVVIKPGQSISYKKLIGPTTIANGYTYAPVMSNGVANKLGVGGGVCQVSTTLYNAALKAGLTDIKSRNHSGRVSYVVAGTDAVISDYSDLVIKNTYNEDIMIESSYVGGKLTVKIKSVNPLLGGKTYAIKTTSSKSGLTVKLDLIEKNGKKERVVYSRVSDYVR